MSEQRAFSPEAGFGTQLLADRASGPVGAHEIHQKNAPEEQHTADRWNNTIFLVVAAVVLVLVVTGAHALIIKPHER